MKNSYLAAFLSPWFITMSVALFWWFESDGTNRNALVYLAVWATIGIHYWSVSPRSAYTIMFSVATWLFAVAGCFVVSAGAPEAGYLALALFAISWVPPVSTGLRKISSVARDSILEGARLPGTNSEPEPVVKD
jgi:hypothetical protein